MAKVSTTEARQEFAEVLNRVSYGHERIVLHRRGKELVAIVPLEDLELLEKLEDEIDLAEARRALARSKKEGTTSWASIKKKLGLGKSER